MGLVDDSYLAVKINLAGNSWRKVVPQVLLQMLSWRLRPFAVQLRSFGGHPLLQAPFLPAFQGEGELQPSDQMCNGQARRGTNSTGCTSSAGGRWCLLLIYWRYIQSGFGGRKFGGLHFLLSLRVPCCMLCSSSGDTGTYLFLIPFGASSITLLNHGTDVISREVEIVVHHVLCTSFCSLLYWVLVQLHC